MNIDSGEIRQFATNDDLKKFFSAMSKEERDKWIEVDEAKMTKNQLKELRVRLTDHRSDLAVQRDIIRKSKRAERRRKAKGE